VRGVSRPHLEAHARHVTLDRARFDAQGTGHFLGGSSSSQMFENFLLACAEWLCREFDRIVHAVPPRQAVRRYASGNSGNFASSICAR
jgi:hypothetical protein